MLATNITHGSKLYCEEIYEGDLGAYLGGSKNSPNGLGDLRSDTVTFDEGYCVVSLQALSTQEL